MRAPTQLEARVGNRLTQLKHSDMFRSLRTPSGISLCSNDYLGLARHPQVKARMVEGILHDGCGSTGSRLLSGQCESFAEVERRFAKWKGTEDALFLGSGYLANLGVITTFPQAGDVIFSDELNHASLIDGIRLSKAQKVPFRHCDVDALARAIEKWEGTEQKFLVTESLFSMDGDEAPLREYAALCRATNTALIVDEAHAVGVWGLNGSGLISESGVDSDVFLSINPAGKALGVGGAFVAGPRWAIQYMIQSARSLIFSTAPPPCMAYALKAAIELIEGEPERRSRLLDLSFHFRQRLKKNGVRLDDGASQIVPVILGETDQAVHIAEELQTQGYDVRVIRPPSVPAKSCRLRISLNVGLTDSVLEGFVYALATSLDQRVGLQP